MHKLTTAAAAFLIAALALTGCSAKQLDTSGAKPAASEATDADTKPTPEPAPEPEPEVGTLANPGPVGSAVDSKQYDGTTFSSTFALTQANANQYVADANMFNEAAPAGMHYAVVTVTLTNTSADAAKSVRPGSATYDLAIVDAATSQTYPSKIIVLPNDIGGQPEIYTGQTATGEVAFLVPDTATTLLIASGGVFVAL